MRVTLVEQRFTDEQIAQANSNNIIDYAKSRGYPVRQVTTHSYKIPGFGGLYIHSGGLKWNRFSADIGGGTIQFVMHMENKSWVEAVKELLNIPTSQCVYPSSVQKEFYEKESEKKPFQLPEKNDTYKHLFAYVISTRKLDRYIVYDLVKLNKIYENKHYNCCVFVGYDKDENPKYAAIRGTNPALQYRKDVVGSDKSYPFIVDIRSGIVCKDGELKSKNLFVFESPIDLMSYLTLLKTRGIKNFEAHCISLGGVCDLALKRFLNEHTAITDITLGLDNDEAGRFACEQIFQKYSDQYAIWRHLPENKDFNDDLIKFNAANTEEQGREDDEEVEEDLCQ
jgi:hypothetical protein